MFIYFKTNIRFKIMRKKLLSNTSLILENYLLKNLWQNRNSNKLNLNDFFIGKYYNLVSFVFMTFFQSFFAMTFHFFDIILINFNENFSKTFYRFLYRKIIDQNWSKNSKNFDHAIRIEFKNAIVVILRWTKSLRASTN